jgi:hypothetical protein
MQKILIYIFFGFFLFLIMNNFVTRAASRTIEGVENKKPNDDKKIKCPEDCTSVKELQKKLSDSLKSVQNLEKQIEINTQTGISHAKSIYEMNTSLDEMQKKEQE